MRVRIEQSPPAAWLEPARLAVVIVGVATLSLWTYYQGLLLYSSATWWSGSLSVASALLRTWRPLWLAGFFPAMAVGLSWYVFSLSRRAPCRDPIRCGLNRLTIAQTYAGLCVSICLFAMSYRLMWIVPTTSLGESRAADAILMFSWGQSEAPPFVPALERRVFVGALGAALATVQGWGLIPQLGGNRRRFVGLAALLLAGGLAAPASGLLSALPSPVPKAIFGLDRRDPVHRGLLLGDRRFAQAARVALDTYLVTHTDDGAARTPELAYETLWSDDPNADLRVPFWRCSVTRLPGTALWTTRGLPVQLSEDVATDSRPSAVIEIPRNGWQIRQYSPGDPAGIGSYPIEELPSRLPPADWIVAKIDFAVSMSTVHDLLATLRDLEVRRVDLAVMPHGFRPAKTDSIRLILDADADATADRLQPRPRPQPPRLGTVVVTQQFVPPSGDYGPRLPTCRSVHDDFDEAWSRFELEPEGSLPERAAVSVTADMPYGEFIGRLQVAWSGGVRQVVLPMPASARP